jgi:hypothetical protein
MRRTPRRKPLALTSRDFAIFRVLSRYRYLRSTYIHAFVGGASETRFKERLGDLFHEGFIDRPSKQWEIADARHSPAIYEIGNGAQRALAEHGECEDGPRTFLTSTTHRQFAHSVMICGCLASIELAALANTSLRFIPWSEILARAPASTRSAPIPFRMPTSTAAIVPDGFFGLEYQSEEGAKAYRFCALEVDRGTMPIVRTDPRQTSYIGKLAAYQELIETKVHKRHLGISSLFVLSITTSEQRRSEIVRRFGELGDNPLFLFKAIKQCDLTTPSPGLILGSWQRAGLSPLRIDE